MNKKMLLPLVLILVLLSACNAVRGSGKVESETRAVSGFDQVSLSGQGELVLTQGDQESVRIEAEENIIAAFETEVKGDTLYIGVKENTVINPTKPIKFFVTMRDIGGLQVSGAGSIVADSVETDRLTLDVSESGSINIGSLSADSLVVDVSNSGSVEVAGKATDQEVVISDSGNYQAADLESEAVNVEVNGAGEATVWANQSLTAETSGSSNVNYYGSPTVSQDISDVAEVSSLGAR